MGDFEETIVEFHVKLHLSTSSVGVSRRYAGLSLAV
jgi:hypothetical protein